jgi:hypothetical protein
LLDFIASEVLERFFSKLINGFKSFLCGKTQLTSGNVSIAGHIKLDIKPDVIVQRNGNGNFCININCRLDLENGSQVDKKVNNIVTNIELQHKNKKGVFFNEFRLPSVYFETRDELLLPSSKTKTLLLSFSLKEANNQKNLALFSRYLRCVINGDKEMVRLKFDISGKTIRTEYVNLFNKKESLEFLSRKSSEPTDYFTQVMKCILTNS